MKTTEEKAKAYNRAIEQIRKLRDVLINNGVITKDGIIDYNFQRIFPELKESEDEKMLNQLHSWMKEFGGAEEYTEKVYCWIKGLLEKLDEKFIPENIDEAALQYVDTCAVDGEVTHDNVTEPYWNNHSMMEAYKAGWLKQSEWKLIWSEEDEKIRKELIKETKSSEVRLFEIVTNEEFIAWLKKQGEHANFRNKIQVGDKVTRNDNGELVNLSQLQRVAKPCNDEHKPANKVEPKFKVGDWIIHNKNTELANSLMLVTDKVSDGYLCKYRDGQCSYNIEFIDKEYHLWTIQDAKDGDVLVNGSNIFIFSNLLITRAIGYCHINLDDRRFYDDKGRNECFGLIDTVFTPATKEEQDLLFSKMEEAGYEWDAEKKELKKIKQNSAWSEEDEAKITKLKTFIAQCNGFSRANMVKVFAMIDSLTPYSQWKPSDGQMGALKEACGEHWEPDGLDPLYTLYQDLKKLKA